MNRRPRSYQERALPLSYPGSCPNVLSISLFITIFLVEGVGFEPTKSFRTPDLQSGGFNHSPIPPDICIHTRGSVQLISEPLTHSVDRKRAPEGTRTPNLSITNRMRYHCATGACSTLDASSHQKMTPYMRGHFADT